VKMTREQLAKTLENPAVSVEGGKEAFLRLTPDFNQPAGSKAVKMAPATSYVKPHCPKCNRLVPADWLEANVTPGKSWLCPECVKTAPSGSDGEKWIKVPPRHPECVETYRRVLPKTTFALHHTTDENRLNKTERAYLAHLRMLGFPWIGVQNITLKLGDDCRYLPDFSVITANGEMEFHETKGFMRPQALVKLKVAARSFPMFRFIVVRRVKGGWTHSPVKP